MAASRETSSARLERHHVKSSVAKTTAISKEKVTSRCAAFQQQSKVTLVRITAIQSFNCVADETDVVLGTKLDCAVADVLEPKVVALANVDA